VSGGFYVKKDGMIHRLHPVTRIVMLALSFACALALSHPLHFLVLFLVFGAFGAGAGVFSGLRRVWWLLILIALASFVIWSLTYHGGRVVWSAGPIELTGEGLLFGAGMGLRLDLMIFCGLIFLAATPVEEFTYGLTRMGLPFPVSFALSLSFRLAPLFADTVRTIQDAQRARGLDSDSGPVARMRSYVPLLAPVFSSALRRTDQLAMALESKGFGLGRPRGSVKDYAAGWRDALGLAFMCALFALAVCVRWIGL
jgi:energy-coupling factor transport system permease protein